jgi:hypothetical protein
MIVAIVKTNNPVYTSIVSRAGERTITSPEIPENIAIHIKKPAV